MNWDAFWTADETLADRNPRRMLKQHQERIVELSTDCYPEGAKVAILGSGDVDLADRFADKGHEVVCYDPSEIAIKMAKKKGYEVKQVDFDVIKYDDWEPESYDVVAIPHVLEALEEPQHLLRLAEMLVTDDGFTAIAVHKADPRTDLDSENFPELEPFAEEEIAQVMNIIYEGRGRLETHNNRKLTLAFVGEPPKPTLALCLMAWNEGQFLARCLESVPYDELIIGVDDASCDTEDGENNASKPEDSWTYKIAQEYVEEAGGNSQVFLFEHMVAGTDSYNFSERRNQTFERATADWIIQIDAHEFLNKESMRMGEVLCWAGEKEIFHIIMHRDGNYYHKPHIWENTGEYCYENAVHNLIAREDGEPIDLWLRTLMHGVHCYHQWTPSKAEERAEQRNKSNLRALMKEAEENPESERPWFFMGNVACGEERWDEAIAVYSKCLELMYKKHKVNKELEYQCLLIQGKVYAFNGQFAEAKEKLLPLAAIQQDRAEHYVYLGDVFAKEGEIELAKTYYQMASHFKPPITCMFVEEKLYGWYLQERLFMTNVELRQWDEALDKLEDMVDLMPRDVYEARVGQTVRRFKATKNKLQG